MRVRIELGGKALPCVWHTFFCNTVKIQVVNAVRRDREADLCESTLTFDFD